MKRRVTEYHFDGLAVLLLFSVFAACLAVVLLMGADAYRRLVKRDAAVFERCICMQYIATRVRQAEAPDKIKVETFGDGNALTLTDDTGYITRVYYYNGHIMELYTDADTVLSPEAGEQVMEAGGLELLLENGMLTVTAIDTEGELHILRLSVYRGGETEL